MRPSPSTSGSSPRPGRRGWALVALAVAAGGIWGALVPQLLGAVDPHGYSAEWGRWLAVAVLLGILAGRPLLGAAAALGFAVAVQIGMEIVPWDGIAAQARDAGLARDDAQFVADEFDRRFGLDWWLPPASALLGAAGGLWHAGTRGRAVAAGALGGALASGLVRYVPGELGGAPAAVAAVQAAIGVAVAAGFARRHVLHAAGAALVALALVVVPDRLLASTHLDLSTHPEIQIVR